ncbi:Lrp/AsnC family transcriptional regulator [Corynebacterium epidermidicanis]|uniref:Transcriptional regulator n=1 Tax=Corynebacterium epidermidicanis TaxID=1050174 RepID=A0A0G3GY04_9CORY|nr:Lrp/AsnC family transcriptional regulator [Corynebacterium epidermidicanis]AKK03702.1 transcriptional regulator [Corynebacterium epidermidicanis]
MLNRTDLDIIGALFYDPRASIDTLAHVADVSPSTASRRLKQLIDSHRVHIVGEVAWQLFSDSYPVHAWIRVLGTDITSVARTIAALPEAQHVATIFGREPIFTTLNARSDSALLQLIDDIQQIPGVSTVMTLPILTWAAKASGWNPRLLSDSQVSQIPHPQDFPTRAQPAGFAPTKTELTALRGLQRNGRFTAAELSTLAKVSAPTAQRTINRIIDRGWLRPRVECNLADIGITCRFLVRIQTDPQHTEAVLRAVSSHPANRFVTQVAGDADIFAVGVCTDRQELARIINEDLANIPGVRGTRTDIIARDWKRYWHTLGPDGELGDFRPPKVR